FLNPGGSGLVRGNEHHPIQSALWTFSRVFANEFQNLSVKSIDVNLDNTPEKLTKIFLQTATDLNQNELICQDDLLLASKVVKGLPPSNYKPATNVGLSFNQPGSLEGLNWVEIGDVNLGETDVEIDVAATALNFRDLMWAMGMLPEEALEDGYGGASMGLECSGRVLRVGKQVEHLQVGDQVVAFTSAGFGNRVVVPAFGVAKLPEHQELISAATMPVAFLTAYYSLMELGGLKKDQWVVIHGAAGGVGLAALQIVKWAGAKVIATAGSEEKRELLKILGAEHVLNSRSLEFAEQVKQITGEGAHIVLNSLAGEAMERGIEALRPFGRFLELGKRDYYANTKIGLRPFRKNVSYFGIDLDQLLKHDQEYASSMIKDVFSLVNEGTFTPLPYRVFEGEQVQDAFRLMQRSGQIGKILIRPPSANTIKVLDKVKPISFSAEGAHVIIGGLGGFGSEIAKWVADHGAKTIVLTSRKGVIDKQHEEVIKKLKLMGVTIIVKSCDVTHRISVENLLSELREIMPIKSIIHAAMVLDDGIITSLDAERFEKVLSPKIKGADNLNKLTWQDELEHFILFSSATTMFGNPGQANYVAANGYLEGLARERRLAGRPAISVGWGAIGDVGFLAQNQETSDKLSRFLGDAMIGARQGLDVLADAMARDDGKVESAVLHIGKFDWTSAYAALPTLRGKMFEKIVNSLEKSADTETKIDLAELIAGKDDNEAIPIISELMKSEISTILRLPMEEIDLVRPLSELGMDSLMGLELRMSIQKKFDLEMPLVALSGTTNLSDIVTQMLKTIKASENADTQTLEANKMMLAQQHLSTDTDIESLLAIDKMVDQKRKNSNGLME
ncbi:MAG: SDR family NAD(P)-dependent oxidoreductase, partial [Rhizobiaceae bacterium]|nr:SDR family NAD(P)-dependent oxidoreductase [Rhizobiaceae bacterium]